MIKRKIDIGDNNKKNRWLPLYISMILIVLTFFISLSSYTIKTMKKMKSFQKSYKQSLVFKKGKSRGRISILNRGEGDKLAVIIKDLREKGLSKKKVEEYLNDADLIKLGIKVGDNGASLSFPSNSIFEKGKTKIDPKAYVELVKIGYLAKYLPYYIYIEGFSTKKESGNIDSYEFAALKALEVYNFFKQQGVEKRKMVIMGYGNLKDNKKTSFLKIKFVDED